MGSAPHTNREDARGGGRVYVRRFDHDEASRRRAAGVPVMQLAAEYGVTPTAVYFATTPGARERNTEYAREWRKTTCSVCGDPAQKQTFRGEAPRCRKCANVARITTVRETELQCARCREWKPDAAFSSNRWEKHRRERHTVCRPCSTEIRREYRNRTKVPCERCGKPRLADAPGNGLRGDSSGLCLTCWRETRPVATHCHRGHEFTAENTYTRPNGHRECRACSRLRGRVSWRQPRDSALFAERATPIRRGHRNRRRTR